MSLDESRSSTPLVFAGESLSPAPSSSLPDSLGAYSNGLVILVPEILIPNKAFKNRYGLTDL